MRRGSIFVVSALMGGFMAGFLPITHAAAGSCGVADGFSTFAGVSNAWGAKIGEAGSGMKVFDPAANCIQVRSVYVFVDLSNYVEVGYFEDASGELAQCQTFSSPHFLAYAVDGGQKDCMQQPPPLASGSFYRVRVQNPDHNNSFEYYLNTSLQKTYSVAFTRAQVQAGSERRESSESLRSDMDGLASMGNGGNYNTFGAAASHVPLGSISGWNYCIVTANYHYRVVQGSC